MNVMSFVVKGDDEKNWVFPLLFYMYAGDDNLTTSEFLIKEKL